MHTFTPSLSERKRILKNVCRTHPQWKLRMGFAAVLVAVAAVIMGGVVVLLATHPTTAEGVALFLAAAFCFACVPYVSAIGLKNASKYKCAFPYSSYANGSLTLTDDKLEYAFWIVGKNEPAAYSSKRAVYLDEDKFIYTIAKNDVQSLKVRNDICHINGRGVVQGAPLPDWAVEEGPSTGEFVIPTEEMREFSFALAFEQKNAADLLDEWLKGWN